MSRGNTGVRNIDLIYEVMRKRGKPMSLKEICDATGIVTGSVSALLSTAIGEGQPVERVERGVYAMTKTPAVVVDEIKSEHEIVAMKTDGSFVMADGAETTPSPVNTTKENGRIRRVRQRMDDLDRALNELSFYMTKLEAKARAYDKIQYAVNGHVEDPM